MKPLFLAPFALFLLSACSLTERPLGGLTPTSGAQVASAYLPDVPADAWVPLEAEGRDLPLRALERSELGGDLGVKEPFPEYNRGSLSSAARIFLVAGSAADASYLQEIVVLRDYWLGEGYSPEQIVCYYVKPEKADYEADQKRFDSMATRTENFYLAAPHVLYKHLADVGRQNPRAVSLYINGAGKAPAKGSQEEVALAAQYPAFAGSYRIVLRGGPSGHMNERMRLEALRDGIDAHYLIFNAEFFAEALRALPPLCEKFIVLNADYSGGFLSSQLGDDGILRSLPNAAILTSARHDRKNLAEGGEMTQFGGLLLSALSNGSGPIESRSWRGLANEMILTSDRTEQSAGVPHRDRSRPVFFSSLGREAGPMAEPAVEVASVEAPLPEPVVERPSRNRQIEEEVAPPQAMEGERVGTIEVEVLPPPVMKPKAKSLPVGVPVAEVAPAESTPPREGPSQWLKNLTAPKATSTAASDPAPDRAMPKSTVAPRPGAALGLGRSGFGH